MIETRTKTTNTIIKQEKIFDMLLNMSNDGWEPAILDSHRSFLKSASLSDEILPDLFISESQHIVGFSAKYKGDIFFKGEDIYFFRIIDPNEIYFSTTTAKMKGRKVLFDSSASKRRTEIGIISPNSKEISKKLDDFTKSFEKALNSATQQKIEFKWKEIVSPQKSIKNILKNKDKKGLDFSKAILDPEEVKGSDLLKIKENREMLIELSKAGFAIKEDILNRREKNQHPKIIEIISSLKSKNLIKEDYILQCKETKAQLSILEDKSLLASEELSNLKCPVCNTEFKNEYLSERYSLTELGFKLSQKSYWMTIWITKLLNDLGIPLESIIWNISEAGEEIDLLIDFLGQVWIFELKDKEFGSGNAHPLNYRGVIYGADKAIIATTEIVSRDAKQVFAELEQKSGGSTPIYIEGVENAEQVLLEQVSEVTFDYADKKLSTISDLSGYSCEVILQQKYNGVNK